MIFCTDESAEGNSEQRNWGTTHEQSGSQLYDSTSGTRKMMQPTEDYEACHPYSPAQPGSDHFG